MSYPTNTSRFTRTDTETTCHCGGSYFSSDHCGECGCEQYECRTNGTYWCEPEQTSMMQVAREVFARPDAEVLRQYAPVHPCQATGRYR